jgi:Ca2+-binding EF-hand superfamily protein
LTFVDIQDIVRKMSETTESLIKGLREQILKTGCNGIKGLGVIFRAMDIDYSKRIVYEELKVALKRLGVIISDNYLHTLFDALDLNKSGGIDFCEFMYKLRPPMNQCRIDVIKQAFEKLDVNKDDAIMLGDLKGIILMSHNLSFVLYVILQ